jgi:hypothetical protein
MITDYLTSMEVRLVKTPEEKEAVFQNLLTNVAIFMLLSRGLKS